MRVDYCVIGGGIVGLATAYQVLRKQPDASLLLLEKETAVAVHQTGRNSGVIHSGVYYEPGSYKAELCRRGARATKQFATEHAIPYEEIGKLIVATDEHELGLMFNLYERTRINGVPSELLDASGLNALEPAVTGLGALFVRETAIIDYRAVSRALAHEISDRNGDLRFGARVVGIDERPDAVRVRVDGPCGAETLECRQLVACAGLQADRLARMAGVAPKLAIVPFRGEYFLIDDRRRGLVSHLIYPVPDPSLPFLGVHLSPTVDGRLLIGPSAVLGLARENYRKFTVDREDLLELVRFAGIWRLARRNLAVGAAELFHSLSARAYLGICRRYCPSLKLRDLLPYPTGIRAQAVSADGSLVHDFAFETTARTIHVLNAPSPAATSALPIGEHLAARVLEREP